MHNSDATAYLFLHKKLTLSVLLSETVTDSKYRYHFVTLKRQAYTVLLRYFCYSIRYYIFPFHLRFILKQK